MSGALQAVFQNQRSFITVPDAPTIGTATISYATASVPFTAPANNGGSVITTYTATSSPGGITGTLSQSGSGTITVSGLVGGTSYTFTVTATNAVGTSSPSSASNSVTAIAAGQQLYTSTGTYSWTAPAGVTSVSVLAVGAGLTQRGGNLSYINNYSVTPGNTYTVSIIDGFSNNTFVNTSTLYASRGTSKFPTNVGGNSEYIPPASPVQCGGGAAGYVAQNNPSIDGRGAGGDGDAYTYDRSDGSANTGGGGGGGGYWSNGSGTLYAGAGGGVGAYGQGASGYGGTYGSGGGGGSGGSAGLTSGNAGGGGGGIAGAYGGSSNKNYTGTNDSGVIRIIWPGSSRQFPSTNTGNF